MTVGELRDFLSSKDDGIIVVVNADDPEIFWDIQTKDINITPDSWKPPKQYREDSTGMEALVIMAKTKK